MNQSKARELREKRAKLVADARAIYDKSGRTAEDNAKFDAMMAEADQVKVEIDREERLDAAELETRATAKPPASQTGDGPKDLVKIVRQYRTALRRSPQQRNGKPALELMPAEARMALEEMNADYWSATKAYLIGGNSNLSSEARAILQGTRPEFRELGVGSTYANAETRDMGTGGGNALQGSGGGYFVPVGFVNDVEEAMLWYGDMLRSSTIMPTATGQPLPWPTDNDTGNVGALLSEASQVTELDLSLGSTVFNAYKFTTRMIKVSIELMQDSAFDLESYVKDRFAIRLGRILNTKFTLGAGSGSSEPNGIITAATAGPTATGAAANDGGSETGGTTIGTDDLVELEHSVDKAYRRGAAFMAHDTTIKSLKKLKDKYGRPIWLPGLAVASPDTILDYEYFTNNDMATIPGTATNPGHKVVLFGQLKKYIIRQVKELAILRLDERYADYGQIAFVGFARYDGNLLDAGTHPVKYLTLATS